MYQLLEFANNKEITFQNLFTQFDVKYLPIDFYLNN